MSYKLHPLCTLFPRILDEDFISLTQDIKTHGLREPITVHGGFILDGGNRYRACISAGVEPVFVDFSGDSITSFILSANLHRRHLTAGQRGAIVASVQDWSKAQPHGGDVKSDQSARLHLETVADRAAQSGVSTRTQKQADKVAKANPELSAAVARGETSLPKALEQISPPKETPEPEADEPPEYTELDAAHDHISELQDIIAVAHEAPENRELAANQIAILRAEVKTLTGNLKSMTDSRDEWQNKYAFQLNHTKKLEKDIKKLRSPA